MPNWCFDVVCISAEVATQIQERFAIRLGDVHKPRTGPTGVRQILPVESPAAWHRQEDLTRAVIARHGKDYGDVTGSTCTACGVWKWLPVGEDEVPVLAESLDSDFDVIASHEYFGSGQSSFRHLLFRRALGEVLVAASPRNWDLVEVSAV